MEIKKLTDRLKALGHTKIAVVDCGQDVVSALSSNGITTVGISSSEASDVTIYVVKQIGAIVKETSSTGRFVIEQPRRTPESISPP